MNKIFLNVHLFKKYLLFRLNIVNITRRVCIYIHNNIVGRAGYITSVESQNRSFNDAVCLSFGVAVGQPAAGA